MGGHEMLSISISFNLRLLSKVDDHYHDPQICRYEVLTRSSLMF